MTDRIASSCYLCSCSSESHISPVQIVNAYSNLDNELQIIKNKSTKLFYISKEIQIYRSQNINRIAKEVIEYNLQKPEYAFERVDTDEVISIEDCILQ